MTGKREQMADFLKFEGDQGYTVNNTFALNFAQISNITIPANGVVFISGKTQRGGEYSENIFDFPFYSLKNPEISASSKIFHSLKDFQNRQFVTGLKNHVIFVFNDDMYGMEGLGPVANEAEPGDEEGDIQVSFSFGAARISSLPKVLMLEFEGDVHLAADIIDVVDIAKDASIDSYGAKSPDITALMALIGTPTGVSGVLYAFDSAGMQTDSYSALKVLGIDVADPEGKYYLQLVDIHGEPMDTTKIQLTSLEGDVSLAEIEPQNNEIVLLCERDRMITTWPSGIFSSETVPCTRYHLSINPDGCAARFVRLCIFEPYKEYQTDVDENMDVGSNIFKRNKFKVYSQWNKVEVLNNGEKFMGDLYDQLNVLDTDNNSVYITNWDTTPHLALKGMMSIYGLKLCSMDKAEAEESIKSAMMATAGDAEVGAFCVRMYQHPVTPKDFDKINGIEDTDCAVIWDSLKNAGIIDSNGSLQTGPGKFEPEKIQGYKLPIDATFDDQNSDIISVLKDKKKLGNDGLVYKIMIPSGVCGFSGRIYSSGDKAYVKPDTKFFLRIKEEIDLDLTKNTLTAEWKTENLEGRSKTFEIDVPQQDDGYFLNFDQDASNIFNYKWYELIFDPSYKMQLRRSITPADITTKFGDDVKLLIININSGEYMVAEVTEDVVDTPRMLSLDSLLVAFIKIAPGNEFNFQKECFVTSFQQYNYAPEDLCNSRDVMAETQLGGVIRKLLSKNVGVTALYWEKMLSRLESEADRASGEITNRAMFNCIKMNLGNTGHVVLDRSTRAFGAFHQKTTSIVKKVGETYEHTAYLGGMDLTTGRWDTDDHFSGDPERQSSLWHDVSVRIEGEAAIDVLRNFKQRWDAVKYFFYNNIVGGIPADNTERFQLKEIPEFQVDPLKLIKPGDPNAFVQINRTIPPNSSHSRVNVPPDYPYVAESGELGCLNSYINAIRNARKFIHIEDQFLWSREIAQELHNALENNRVEFVIIVLPKELGENEYVDNILYKIRKQAIEIVKGGAKTDARGRLVPKKPEDAGYVSVEKKFLILNPVTEKGETVYVHSKHLIVDDVWMSIGSSNIGNRSMTYDFEIDAAIVGKNLNQGASEIVRTQRMELWRRHLNIPASCMQILKDPYNGFMLFNEIHKQEDIALPEIKLHPFVSPRVAKVNPSYVPAGTAEYLVETEEDTDTYFLAVDQFLDPDGRIAAENWLDSTAIKYPPEYFIRLRILFPISDETGWISEVRENLTAGVKYEVRIKLQVSGDLIEPYYVLFAIKSVSYDEERHILIVQDPDFVLIPYDAESVISAVLAKQGPGDNEPVELDIGDTITVVAADVLRHEYIDEDLTIHPN